MHSVLFRAFPFRRGASTRVAAFRLLIAAATFASSGSLAVAEDLIGLYLSWSHDPTTTMTVNWVDIYADSSKTVWVRELESDDWSSVQAVQSTVGPTTMQLRRVELTGLKPGTLYEFGIGDERSDVSHYYRFRTMPADLKEPVSFVAGGDMMHTREKVDDMNRVMQRLDPDFALLMGDLAYANGVVGTRWIDWLQSWRTHSVAKGKRIIPLVVSIGNHEVKKHYDGRIPEDAPYFYSLFALPDGRSNYALDFGKYLSLIVLDSQHTQPVAGSQAEWLEQALAERADQQFLFAGYHYPAYGTTKAPRGKLPIDAALSVSIREHWIPHFERYGVSALFENDHHNFKRSHRIRNHQRDDENGLLYLGDGSWGVVPREVPAPGEAWWLAKAEGRNHLWHVEIRSDGHATLSARDVEGEVFDQVELERPRTIPVDAPKPAPRELEPVGAGQ